MSQTKKQSLKEAVSNTAVGFVVSILRGYVIRRWFNKKATKKERVTYPSGEDFLLHCFDCEIEMPVIKKEQNYYCSNCGLKH